MNKAKIKALQINIASPEQIRGWSHGEITKSETINYKTLKPEEGGLFDEAIFGPIKDYECACGKYKKVKYRGKICERCGVEIIESIVRRERMGHIELAVPVAHIWFVKEIPNPSKISLLLDVPYREIEEVVYFVNYIVLNGGDQKVFKDKEVIDLTNPKVNKTNRGRLRTVLSGIMEKLEPNTFDHTRATEYYERLKDSSLPFTIDDLFNFIKKHTNIRFGIGAEAIHELLKNLDLKQESERIKNELTLYDPNHNRFKKLMRQLEVFNWFIESNNRPEWMILNVIPVTPPDTRPIIQLDGGRFTTSDINNFYRKIIIRNERLKKIIAMNAPTILLNNEKRMLQEAVDALFDNAARGKQVVAKDKRPLKSLSDHLKGKQGLFRQNLLGKRVDYSGRSVIVVGPELKMYEVGIPALMLLKLFKPFLIHELIRKHDEYGREIKPYAANIKVAEQMILRQDNVIWPLLQKIIKERPVLLNRAPTLHRLGIQAFEPKMIDGKAIRLHPLVTTAFNADFDGDQMAVHLPLSKESVNEARDVLLASWHILGPKDGKPIIVPTQDMILGSYYSSQEFKNLKGERTIFRNVQEALRAYDLKQVDIHALIGITTKAYPDKKWPKQGFLITTIGKIILNTVFPSDADFVNSIDGMGSDLTNDIVAFGENFELAISSHQTKKPFTKKTLQKNIAVLYSNYPVDLVAKTTDEIKRLGFKYSTQSSWTLSAFELPSIKSKQAYFDEAEQKIARLKYQFQKGLLTDEERYKKVINLWTNVKQKVTTDVEDIMRHEDYVNNSVVIMAESGARGNVSQFTQLLGMRGLMSKSYNYDQKSKSRIIKDVIEIPIKHSFMEGLTISEYFNSSYGARKGMADTAMKTSKSGYMTRKLVDAAQEVIISEEDCGTTHGLMVEAIVNTKDNSVIESLASRIANRFALNDIFHPTTNEILVHKNEIITEKVAEQIEKAGIKQVEIRSVLHCKSKNGICQKCFGNDLTTNKPIAINTAIGVIAAQSIGEPGTQLTMRTFHTGGAAGEGNIAQGFERLKQIFDLVPPKDWEKAIIAEIGGTVTGIELKDENYEVKIKYQHLDETIVYLAPLNAIFRVKVNQFVNPGDKITEGSININELLKVAGIEAARDYMIKEIQKVYRIQGIEISDKYIEVIIRQISNKMKVLNPGDSNCFIGQIIDINYFNEVNTQLMKENKNPITAINLVFALESVPSKAESFLSAASFQDTKKILIDAAVRSQTDLLLGLKENVMLGNLIPAGTGYDDEQTINENGEKMYKKEY